MADSTLSFELNPCSAAWEGLSSSDSALLDGLCAGDERAYEELVLRFQQPVYNLVYRLVSDPAEACDVVQDVFLKVFRSVGRFRGQSSLKTWIYRIAVNEAHNHHRWFHRRGGDHHVGLADDQGEGLTYEQVLADEGQSPFQIACGRQARAHVEEALKRVKPVFREALVLREIEELTYEEIAGILQVNLGTVKSRILRGREALRELLSQAGVQPEAELAAQGAK